MIDKAARGASHMTRPGRADPKRAVTTCVQKELGGTRGTKPAARRVTDEATQLAWAFYVCEMQLLM